MLLYFRVQQVIIYDFIPHNMRYVYPLHDFVPLRLGVRIPALYSCMFKRQLKGLVRKVNQP